ncbi:MAG: hypothetical protein QW639_05245 [Candidatus Bathyarchaeia archaeon]
MGSVGVRRMNDPRIRRPMPRFVIGMLEMMVWEARARRAPKAASDAPKELNLSDPLSLRLSKLYGLVMFYASS